MLNCPLPNKPFWNVLSLLNVTCFKKCIVVSTLFGREQFRRRGDADVSFQWELGAFPWIELGAWMMHFLELDEKPRIGQPASSNRPTNLWEANPPLLQRNLGIATHYRLSLFACFALTNIWISKIEHFQNKPLVFGHWIEELIMPWLGDKSRKI